MEKTEGIEHCHIYQYCPPWGLKQFQGRRVTLVGRVTEVLDQNSFVLELDQEQRQEIQVHIKPFDFCYLFSPDQFDALAKRPEYHTFQSYLFPEKRMLSGENRGQSDEWFLVPQQNEQKMKQVIKSNTYEPIKRIDAKYFLINQYIEVRGQLKSGSDVLLEEFTDLGDDLDLRQYNKTLALMINNTQHLYY